MHLRGIKEAKCRRSFDRYHKRCTVVDSRIEAQMVRTIFSAVHLGYRPNQAQININREGYYFWRGTRDCYPATKVPMQRCRLKTNSLDSDGETRHMQLQLETSDLSVSVQENRQGSSLTKLSILIYISYTALSEKFWLS